MAPRRVSAPNIPPTICCRRLASRCRGRARSAHLGAPESIGGTERLDRDRRSLRKRKPPISGDFDGASRTRTDDLLGAIPALSSPEFGLSRCFSGLRAGSPNTFPNSLQLVLQYDNARCCGRAEQSERRPVTPEVAGSSHVAPVNPCEFVFVVRVGQTAARFQRSRAHPPTH
jgi:hypothetical protein